MIIIVPSGTKIQILEVGYLAHPTGVRLLFDVGSCSFIIALLISEEVLGFLEANRGIVTEAVQRDEQFWKMDVFVMNSLIH